MRPFLDSCQRTGFQICANRALSALLVISGFFVVVGPGWSQGQDTTSFRFTDGNKEVTITTPIRSAAYDGKESLAKGLAAGVKMTDEQYYDAGYTDVRAGEEINGYKVRQNVPSHRQMCGGLALARLTGGPYVMNTQEAWKVVEKFARPVPTLDKLEKWDLVIWHAKGNPTNVSHLALVESVVGGVKIVGKNAEERAYRGPLERLPAFADLQKSYYSLDWDAIDVFRQPAEKVVLPALPHGGDGAKWMDGPNVRPRDKKFILESTIAIGLREAATKVIFHNAWSKTSRGGRCTMNQFTTPPSGTNTGPGEDPKAAKIDYAVRLTFEQAPTVKDATKRWALTKEEEAKGTWKKSTRGDITIYHANRDIKSDKGTIATHHHFQFTIGWWNISYVRGTSRIIPAGAPKKTLSKIRDNEGEETERVLDILLRYAQSNEIGNPERPRPFQLD